MTDIREIAELPRPVTLRMIVDGELSGLHTVYRNQTQAQVNRFISGVSALATPSDTGRITIRVEEER